MSELDVIARRATDAIRTEAELLAVASRGAVQAAVASGDTSVDLDVRMPSPPDDERRASRRWLAAAAALVAVVGAVSVAVGGDEPGTLAGVDEQSDQTSPSLADEPVSASDADSVPPSWTGGQYYVGGGLTFETLPQYFTMSSEERGFLVRTTEGTLGRVLGATGTELSALTYRVTLDDTSTGRSISVTFAAPGAQVPFVSPTAAKAWVTVDAPGDGDYTLGVSARGFADDASVALTLSKNLRLDPERLLDRYDVAGGFDSVLQRGGTSSWSLEQGEVRDGVRCLRLVVARSTAPGGWNFCLPDDGGNHVGFVRIDDRSFVAGWQGDPDTIVQPTSVRQGGRAPFGVYRQGWTGAVVAEVPAGTTIASLDGGDTRCAPSDLADSLGEAVAFRVTDCSRDAAVVTLLASVAGWVATDVPVARDGDGWEDNPFGQFEVYLGGGLTAGYLPPPFDHRELVDGRFTMDVGGSDDSHAVTLTASGFGDQPSLQIGYVRDGVPGAFFDGDTVAARREGGLTFWAASDSVPRERLDEVVSALVLDSQHQSDDGELGEFGAVIATSGVENGWVDLTIVDATTPGGSPEIVCLSFAEKVFGRPPPTPAVTCLSTDVAELVVVRGASTYVVGFGGDDIGLVGDLVVNVRNGDDPPVRTFDLGRGDSTVSLAVVPSGKRLSNVGSSVNDVCPTPDLFADSVEETAVRRILLDETSSSSCSTIAG